MRDDAEFIPPSRSSEPGWGLVRLGLILLRGSLIVLLAAALTSYVGVLRSGSGTLANRLSTGSSAVVTIASFVALPAAIVGFIGMALCCTVPGGAALRFQICATLFLLLVAGVSGCWAVILIKFKADALPTVRNVLISVSAISGSASVMFWLLFLKGVAHHFCNHELAQNAAVLLVLAFLLLPLNSCLMATFAPESGPNPPKDFLGLGLPYLIFFVPLVIPCALYGWHLRLIVQIRRTIPARHQPGP
jgi:hypothetical protein